MVRLFYFLKYILFYFLIIYFFVILLCAFLFKYNTITSRSYAILFNCTPGITVLETVLLSLPTCYLWHHIKDILLDNN